MRLAVTFRANRGSCPVVGARLLVCSLAVALDGAVFVDSIFVLCKVLQQERRRGVESVVGMKTSRAGCVLSSCMQNRSPGV